MINIKKLIKILSQYPSDCIIYAYEGEDCGLVIVAPDGKRAWIRAYDDDIEDVQNECVLK